MSCSSSTTAGNFAATASTVLPASDRRQRPSRQASGSSSEPAPVLTEETLRRAACCRLDLSAPVRPDPSDRQQSHHFDARLGRAQKWPRPGDLLAGRGLDRFNQSGGWWEAIHAPSCSDRRAKVWVWQRKCKELLGWMVSVCRGCALRLSGMGERWAERTMQAVRTGLTLEIQGSTATPPCWGWQGALRVQWHSRLIQQSRTAWRCSLSSRSLNVRTGWARARQAR